MNGFSGWSHETAESKEIRHFYIYGCRQNSFYCSLDRRIQLILLYKAWAKAFNVRSLSQIILLAWSKCKRNVVIILKFMFMFLYREWKGKGKQHLAERNHVTLFQESEFSLKQLLVNDINSSICFNSSVVIPFTFFFFFLICDFL